MTRESKMGRPTEYNEDYPRQAYRHCLLGATDEQLGELFGVTETTVNNWKQSHPDFFESIKRGKQEADASVAEKLYGRAIGYTYTEKKTVKRKVGKTTTVEMVDTEKQVAADTTAQIFWLKNRQPKLWRDKQQIEHSGEITNKNKYDTSALSTEEKTALLEKMGLIPS